MKAVAHLTTSPERSYIPSPRDVLSYHVTDSGEYRAVVVRWTRHAHSTSMCIHRIYTAPSPTVMWFELWLHGHIIRSTFENTHAYRTFIMLGRGTP